MNKRSKFGRGYPAQKIERDVKFNPVCSLKEISPSIDIVEPFRINKLGDSDSPNCPVRIRSDVSMILHAESTAKKMGIEGYNFLTESRRTKTSAIQQEFDKMDDKLLLDTIKSKYYQSPSELLAWSEQLTDLAVDCKNRYNSMIDEVKEKQAAEMAALAAQKAKEISDNKESPKTE